MRKKDITENPFRKFQQGVAKGFTATQKGGSIGPDSFAQGIKNFFTNTGKDEPVKDKKDKEIEKLKKDIELSKKQQSAKDKKMDKKANVKEGLADLAGRAEADHEVQMARADLYKIAKYAIKLHDMLKGVSEEQGLEGWQQAKITKAADYIGSVYHNLDYDMKFGEAVTEAANDCDETCPKSCPDCGGTGDPEKFKKMKANEGKSPHKKGTAKYKKHMAAMHAEDTYKSNLAAMLERKLTKGEEGKREKYVKGMKKAKGDFKDRYGKDAEAVMYATATKMAKKK